MLSDGCPPAAVSDLRSETPADDQRALVKETARHFAGPKKPFENALLFGQFSALAAKTVVLAGLFTALLSGDEGIRTPGLRLAKAALSHLSYIPGLGG